MSAPQNPVPAQSWDDFVNHHPNGHLLQLNAWGELKSKFGWKPVRASAPGAGERPERSELTGAQLLLRRFPPPLGKLAYAPRGPVMDVRDAPAASAITQSAVTLARKHRAFALVIEPEMLDTPENAQALRGLGFAPLDWTIQPPRTIWVDLRGEEDAILARMKSKTRYNINLAR
ncbi:MAG TPA: peptidoglycan bridge formation glycyltransferase FemA/FemB family protein, partial [Thermoflexales bacterium]|nr:peptidoglycan bridge formation glycyltransferase FemA/FemB family protein [Thermoflexales bacterium]